MVDEHGHAKLIDFGLSRLIDSVAGPGLTTSTISFSIRWCAPELVQSDDSPTSKASDVYAFASTSLEVGSIKRHIFALTTLIDDNRLGSVIDRQGAILFP